MSRNATLAQTVVMTASEPARHNVSPCDSGPVSSGTAVAGSGEGAQALRRVLDREGSNCGIQRGDMPVLPLRMYLAPYPLVVLNEV